LKRALTIAVLGLLLPMIQGALACFVPVGWIPDASLLLVIALGLGWPGSLATALLLATWLGFVSDMLSGTLIGQHALLSLCAFGAARVVSVHFNLHSAPTQMALAAGLTAGSAFALGALTAFFSPEVGPGLAGGWALLRHTAVNALAAPFAIYAVGALLARLDEDSGRRVLRLEPRRLSP
jgi:cell shape-determining protein MreD